MRKNRKRRLRILKNFLFIKRGSKTLKKQVTIRRNISVEKKLIKQFKLVECSLLKAHIRLSEKENILSFQGWFLAMPEENPENIGIPFNKFDSATSVFIVWTISIYFKKRNGSEGKEFWRRVCNIKSMPEFSAKQIPKYCLPFFLRKKGPRQLFYEIHRRIIFFVFHLKFFFLNQKSILYSFRYFLKSVHKILNLKYLD